MFAGQHADIFLLRRETMETASSETVTAWTSGSAKGFVDGPRCEITECPNILIAEDDPAMADMRALILKSHWLNCVVRHSGAQGYQEFIGEPMDLIITALR